MVIDTSALVALLLNEPDALRIVQAIEAASVRLVSAATFLETSIVIESKKGEAGGRELELLLYRASIEVAPVDQDQAEIARQAWRAGLNYGDCFAYADQRRVAGDHRPGPRAPSAYRARLSPI